jgi:hypothetical protein
MTRLEFIGADMTHLRVMRVDIWEWWICLSTDSSLQRQGALFEKNVPPGAVVGMLGSESHRLSFRSSYASDVDSTENSTDARACRRAHLLVFRRFWKMLGNTPHA